MTVSLDAEFDAQLHADDVALATESIGRLRRKLAAAALTLGAQT